MAAPRTSRDEAERTLEVLHECMEEGFPLKGARGGPGRKSAINEAARRLGIARATMTNRLDSMRTEHDLTPDAGRFRAKATAAPFTLDELPHDGEPDAEELIAQLAQRHRQRKEHHDAAKLRQVRLHSDEPVAIAMFGDPHVDDPGCAWGDLERDVRICRDTPGFLAVDIGDDSNNWVGRLMRLYADQEVTSKQALKLIEWLMTQLPWLLRIQGNHDDWNTEKGDPVAIMHRLHKLIGVQESCGQRLQLTFPGGAGLTAHFRHDFPGGSQFNPAHAMVRETLFGYRDHIMGCGHRHTSGYIPIWHNDPRRLCHGFRVGTYKDFDKYAKEKGFQDGNWFRAAAAVVDPTFADDPVRFIKPFFNLEDAAEYLTWLRARNGRRAAA